MTLYYTNQEVITHIWRVLRQVDITEIVVAYNIVFARVAYEDHAKNLNEFCYRLMLIMLQRGTGIISYSEPHT